ncbi:MAG: molybdopterin-synthase adenylyltransferase MoeB [Methylovulum sp.]|jgi:adenylyltransferase/sulfurtransferase|nr:molybdopterin-synthase adenylyltransferase MoeB [Methylovulum sp.]
MEDLQLLRYSRQIMLPQIDIEGQQRLLNAKVLIIGAGGLGSPVSMYLAAAGVGNITLYDNDVVDLSNLQRQIAHHTSDIGVDKVISSYQTLKNLNPEINISAIKQHLAGEALENAVRLHDVVVDCSDNFSTRFAINKACVNFCTPLVSGAAIRFEGQVAVFTPGQAESPCYNCLYQYSDDEATNCAANGVIAPITGIVGSIQALEAIKLLVQKGETLRGRLLLIDGLTMEFKTIKLKKNPHCPSCGK